MILILLTAGCAALSPLATKPETIEERVISYMQAQVDGKWDQAYSFFNTSAREQVTKESYVSQTRKLAYKGFTIEEITMLPSESGDQATVKVRIDIAFMGYVFPRAPQTQNWTKEKGEWFIKWSAKTTSLPPK
jgi:hypothetical protein